MFSLSGYCISSSKVSPQNKLTIAILYLLSILVSSNQSSGSNNHHEYNNPRDYNIRPLRC